MANVFAAIFSLFGIAVEIFVNLVWILFSGVLRLLGRQGVIDESRVRARLNNVAVALVVCLVAFTCVSLIRSELIERKRKKASELAAAALNDLVDRVSHDHSFEVPAMTDQRDPWGNRMGVVDEVSLIDRSISVASSGPDEISGTTDDIKEIVNIGLRKREIGRNIFDKVIDATLRDGADD